jgi:hypothetical protein
VAIGIQRLRCWHAFIIVTTAIDLRCWCCLLYRNHRHNCGCLTIIVTTDVTVAIGIQHLRCWYCLNRPNHRRLWLLEFNTSGVVAVSIVLTTDVTVAIGIQHLRCWYCLNRPNHRRNCGYWNSTPPVLVLPSFIVTTDVTVAIGIQHLRCWCCLHYRNHRRNCGYWNYLRCWHAFIRTLA